MIGEALKLSRKYSDLSARELAEKAGYSASHVSEVENGHKKPSLAFIQSCAEVFQMRASALILLSEEIEKKKPKTPQAKRKLFLSMVHGNETSN